MRLTDGEFRGMNSALRRLFQRWLEFPVFRWLGLKGKGLDILEVGCGSGYGATLLMRLDPKSYLGVDLMPEMIALANKRNLPNAQFLIMDAADMSSIPTASKDTVVIFGILHHMPAWRQVIEECHRVLRPEGMLFLEEPMAFTIRVWDAIFHWQHPKDALFNRSELEKTVKGVGFSLNGRRG
ncbi:MAG: class I SAM-dependent methyltransferase, partial [Thermoguttaceae bacterium]